MTSPSYISHRKTLEKTLGHLAPYPHHSRAHPLKTLSTSSTSCFVKREDELGFGISGSKLRKYLSLIPYLQGQQVKECILMGGAHSNNIVGLSQLLIQNSIKATLFLRGEKSSKPTGNFLFTSLLIPPEAIHWVSREDWPHVEEKAHLYRQKALEKIIVIPEGASMPEALPGALTLPLDILYNEEQLRTKFDHLFIDAGTGLMAIATLLAFAWLEKPIKVHVVHLAEAEKTFLERLAAFQKTFEQLIQQPLEEAKVIDRLRFHRPTQAKSFGATNKRIFEEIQYLTRQEGFFTDPIYSAKLFLEARYILTNNDVKGNCLLVHSGGGLSLMGFQDQLVSL